ncbi:YcgN family cysteine cluster protein [Acidomonas methanolica]|uniref:YcgN family cysteine cluster protein n=1 Tax=Acidomonas methanolica TaxID=437 RepID=UPI00211A3179|nr:YcgN family cysteine cluster protein [Acidomonas methanolica]MCQ9156125.1 YcgN family cysteine cluster protein [Acidomonas methanolica]
MSDTAPFWKTKSLDAMSRAEWESLCDGCGRCCLHKLRDEETNALHYTNVACRLLDTESCRCTDYLHRFRKVPDCVSLTPDLLNEIDWLPPSCAYVLLRDGKDLPDWHPLVSGSAESVRTSGASAGGRIVSERHAGDLEDHIVAWPGEWAAPPRKGRKHRKGAADRTHDPA